MYLPQTVHSGLCQEAHALIARMSVRPDGARQHLISRMIVDLKSAGIWDKLDVLWVEAAHDEQASRLNWKNNSSFDLTAVNTPTFTADRGYAGNGTTSYLNTNWAPSTNAVNFTQDAASFGQYINGGTSAVDVNCPFGIFGANSIYLIPRFTGDVTRMRVNTGTSQNVGSVSTSYGFSCAQRTSSTANEVFKNGASLGTASQASAGLAAVNAYIGGLNNAPSLTLPTNHRHALNYFGANLSTAQHAAFYAIAQTYMVAVGANV